MTSSNQRPTASKALLLSAALLCCAAQTERRHTRRLEMLLAVKADAARLEQSVEKTIAVMRRRCGGLGVRCEFRREGDPDPDRIGVRITGSVERVRVREVPEFWGAATCPRRC